MPIECLTGNQDQERNNNGFVFVCCMNEGGYYTTVQMVSYICMYVYADCAEGESGALIFQY